MVLVMPKDSHDWQWAFARVPDVLRTLYGKGYQIVILSNQLSLQQGKNRPNMSQKLKFIGKEACVSRSALIIPHCSQLLIPFLALFATARDHFRKPGTGMWQRLIELNKDTPPETNKSFFVGDAAGRDGVSTHCFLFCEC